MGRENKISPEVEQQIVANYLKRVHSIKDQARVLGAGVPTIIKILDKHNIAHRPPGRVAKEVPSLAEFQPQYDAGLTGPVAIARLIGVKKELVRRRLRKDITRGGRKIKS